MFLKEIVEKVILFKTQYIIHKDKNKKKETFMRVDEFIYTAENLMDDSSVSIFQNFENNQIFTYEGLRYSNPLSEIRELFVTWTPSRQILDFSSERKVFRSGA